MNDSVIQATDLTKQYGTFTAVDHINLTVHKGEVYGMLGPNGSGKTTTILMLLGLTEPSDGTVNVLGFDPGRRPLSVKARVGYLPDSVGFYDGLTAWENLRYIARLNGLSRQVTQTRIEAALARVGLADVTDNRVDTFSRGMRQRLGVAELLLKQPELIIMDEPTLGLDPEAARRFLQLIQELKHEGITIMLSSHLLHQVQAVCDRVGLFRNGRIVLEGPVNQLALQVLGGAYRIHVQAKNGSASSLHTVLQGVGGVVDVHDLTPDEYELEAQADLRPEVAEAVVHAGGRLHSLEIETPSLDEIYAQYFEEDEHVITTA
jgi:ABC-2 type transport system ATP-binding protein